MINFENVMPVLKELFLNRLPNYIEEINKEINDGIILFPFENKTLFEDCMKLPCFKLVLLEADYSEKDRIIENTVFTLCMEIKVKAEGERKLIELLRYEKALEKMIQENPDFFQSFVVEKMCGNKVFIKIHL